MPRKKSGTIQTVAALQAAKLAQGRIKQLELDLAEAEEKVYPVAQLRREQAAAVYAMKSKMLSAASRLAPRLAGRTLTPSEVESIIRPAIEEALNELAALGGDINVPAYLSEAYDRWAQGDDGA